MKVKIIVNNRYSRIEGGFPFNEVDRVTSFTIPGSWFSTARKGGYWDGKRHLFKRGSNTFPTGLLSRVRNVLELNKVEYTIVDKRICPVTKFKDYHIEGFELWEHQVKAIEKGLKRGRGIFDMSTASGKSVIAAALIKAIDRPTIIIVHSIDLLSQMRSYLEKYLSVKIGMIGAGKFELRDITVATFATLWSRRNDIKKLYSYFDILIGDEIHKAGAKTNYYIMMQFRSFYRWGLSGSPLDRGDNRNLMVIAVTGEPIYSIKSKEMIKRGLSKKTTVELLEVKDIIEGDTWAEVYQRGIVDNHTRNTMIIRKTQQFLNDDKQVLIFVRNLEHGKTLENMLIKEEISSAFIFMSGAKGRKLREETLEKFKGGELDVVIVTVIWQEGVDLPDLSRVIIASGGKSKIAAKQKVGRGLRLSAKNKDLRVVDFIDFGNKYLANHSLARLKIYKSEGYKIVKGE